MELNVGALIDDPVEPGPVLDRSVQFFLLLVMSELGLCDFNADVGLHVFGVWLQIVPYFYVIPILKAIFKLFLIFIFLLELL